MRAAALAAVALAVLVAAGATGGPAEASGAGRAAVVVPSGPVAWVVGARGPAAARRLARELAARGAPARTLGGLDAVVVAGGSRARALGALAEAGGLAYVEPLLSRALHAEPAEAIDAATGRPFSWAFDEVRAAGGIAAAGGGAPSSPVAVVDSGVDARHPDLEGRVGAGHDVVGLGSVEDLVGHGTFVAGLVSAIDGNGAGGRGVAGATPIVPVRVSTGTSITSASLAAGIVAAVDRGARVINVSIGGPGLAQVERSAIEYARERDVLLVASAGNSARAGNPLEYPAAAIGGDAGGWSAGLSVGATDPLGRPAPFSTHNRAVSIAAPGAGLGACTEGVYSTIPLAAATLWPGGACDRLFPGPEHGPGRYAYGQGTSFSAPMVAGAAALVRQVRGRLRAEQVADVLRRTARQTLGGGWNEFTGAGVLDVAAAVSLAGRYDLTPPSLSLTLDEDDGGVRARAWAEDRTAAGEELAGGTSLGLELSRDGAAYAPLVAPGPGPIDVVQAASAGAPLWVRATACDRNRNCATRAIGPVTGVPAPASGPVADRPATGGSRAARGAITGLGLARGCRPGTGACVRLVWRARPAALGRVRFAVEVRQVPGGPLLARAAGSAPAGRRQVLTLRPRRRPACGRLIARLTIRVPRSTHVAVRGAPVRRGCVRP